MASKRTYTPPVPNRVRLVVASSVMLTFISFWRAAAIVLNDLGSSAFYAGGIAEEAVGKSAPWLILGTMFFSYAVRAVYVESCSMYTRGGVYRIVKEALGGTFAKVSVSALMFDYVLTGPISGVSAGQYIVGLLNGLLAQAAASPRYHHWAVNAAGVPHQFNVNHTSAFIAALITIFFWWQNIKGIEESSEKALSIMKITTVMVVVLIGWGLFSVGHIGDTSSASASSKSDFQPGFSRVPQAHAVRQESGTLRHSDGLWPLRPRHVGRGVAGAGQSRD